MFVYFDKVGVGVDLGGFEIAKIGGDGSGRESRVKRFLNLALFR